MDKLAFQDTVLNNTNLQITASSSNIFIESGNSRISKKTKKKKIVFVPLNVYNPGIDTFYFTNKNLEVFNDLEPVILLEKRAYYRKIRQKTELYLLESTLSGSTAMLLSGGSIGVFIAWYNIYNIPFYGGLFNFYKATKANKKLSHDISELDLLEKKIAPHDKAYALICIKATSYRDLMIRIK